MSDEPLTTPLPEPEPVAQISPVLPVYPPPPTPGVAAQPVTVPTPRAAEPVTFALSEQPVFAPPPPAAPPATPAPVRTLAFTAADLPGRAGTTAAAPPPASATAVAPPPAPMRAVPKVLRDLPPRKRGLLVWGGFGLVVVLLLAAIGYVVYDRYWADPLKHVVKGHCLADLPLVSGDEEVDVTPPRVVPCEDPAAVYVVEGNIKGLSEAQSQDPQVCAAFDDATYVYRSVPSGGRGYVLCLRLLNR